MAGPFSFAPDDPGQAAGPIDYRQFMRMMPWGSWAPHPSTSAQDQVLAASMTHYPEAQNPTIKEANRRLKLTGQNLWNTWVAPAKRLGEAATSGTLDVTDPQTVGDAFGLVSGLAGARM